MDYRTLLNSITPEIYQSLKRAVEIGKWPDGRPLTQDQKDNCLQAIIAYDAQHKPENEQIGHIPHKPHSHCETGEEPLDHNAPRPIRWN